MNTDFYIMWKNKHLEGLVNQYVADNIADFEKFAKEEYLARLYDESVKINSIKVVENDNVATI